jgi:phthalate 4,5-dioxygenase oxygenase subunit
MLSPEDNELLTRVGPGTAMGALMRRYWIPVLQSAELEAGGRVKRVKLLGERLIAYRAKNGTPGLIEEFCPHRRASLYFGRVEEAGMRCVYHGWAFALDGQCVDMPSEPVESAFASKIRAAAYPCAERGGVIWTYMGPVSPPPALPELEWTLLPAPNVYASKRVQECNWFQAMEGGIDSSHIGFLHAPLHPDDADTVAELDRASFGVGAAVQAGDRAPRFDVIDTDYGVLIGARRTRGDGQHYWRVSQYLLPFYTMPPTDLEAKIVQSHIWVPMDDTNVVNWMVRPGAHARGADPARGGQGLARHRVRAAHRGAVRRHPHRRQPVERLRDGLGAAPHEDVLRHPRLRRAGPGHPGEPGADRRPHQRASGHERLRDHQGAPTPHQRGARAA